MAVRKTWESKLKPGSTAPHFVVPLDDNSELDSKNLKGQRVILFFYNHDGTPTCTKEACNIRDNYQSLTDAGFTIFGVSVDSVRKHQGFKAKYELPYPLIHDADNALAKAFDIYGRKEFMGRVSDAVHRTTFIIDPDWKIEHVIHPVLSADHAAQIMGLVGK